MFDNRTYRRQHKKKGLVSFDVTVRETNLNIQADSDLSNEAIRAILDGRNIIEAHIRQVPEFASSLVPLPLPAVPVPNIIQKMIRAGTAAGVGPMAAVAGTLAEHTGRQLLHQSRQVLVENGGDIFVKSDTQTRVTIYAENSAFSMTCGIEIAPQEKPFGICTSSGTLGHSKSFGKADAAMAFSDSCALADAAATALGNRVQSPSDIQNAIDWGKTVPGIRGMAIIKGENIGLWGKDIRLVRL